MRKLAKPRTDAFWLVLGCAVSFAGAAACSGRSTVIEDDGSRGGDAGEPGSGGRTGGSAGATSGGTGANTGGAAAESQGGRGGRIVERGGTGSSGDAGETGTAGESTSGGGGAGGRMFRGVCEQHGYATATTDGYAGYEEFYILTEDAAMNDRTDPIDEDYVCRIRVSVNRVGAAPAGCVDIDMIPCDWTHMIEYSDPVVLIDRNGACALSEIGWDQAFIDGLDGARVSYGYINAWLVHDAPLRIYSEASSQWTVVGRAYWDEISGQFQFEVRHGACRY